MRPVFFLSVCAQRCAGCGARFLSCFNRFLVILRLPTVCLMSLRVQPLPFFHKKKYKLSNFISELTD
jgi:hypothetical protein